MSKGLDLSDYTKIPPQAIETEEVLLGALLIDSEVIPDIFDIITGPEVFYNEHNMHICQSIYDLYTANKKVDIITVTNDLRNKSLLDSIGGPVYITKLTSRVAGTLHSQEHAAILQEKFIRREVIRLSNERETDAYNESIDIQDILAEMSKNSSEISDGLYREAGEHIADAMEATDELVKKVNSGHKEAAMIPTGFAEIDRRLGGLMPSDLILIAARPSFGKTAFALNIAKNIAHNSRIPVGVFSLEMSKNQLIQRLVASEGSFNNNYFKSPMSRDILERYVEARDVISGLDIYIDDNPRVNHIQLTSKCRKMVRKLGVKVIIVDYLQLVSSPAGKRFSSRENEVSEISRSLKIIAKELNVPIVVLSQMNRSVESRSGTKHRPMLSDLRESGSLEQDADIVMFMHSPEKYGILTDDDGTSLAGLVEVIVAKNRSGAIFSTYLGFIKEYTQFVNREDMVFNANEVASEDTLKELQQDFDFNLPE